MRRKLSSILAGMAIIGALLAFAPPANANHFTTDPNPGNPHQGPPAPAVVLPAVACVVVGEVSPGTPGGTPHTIPVVGAPIPGDEASHSHYNFLDSLISCNDTPGFPAGTTVEADGGNDGHFIDPDPAGLPTSLVPGHHPSNGHHGSTNESGWSHCSDYSGDADGSCNDSTDTDVTDAESNVCDANADFGKGDIQLTDLGASGWVKYLRVGVALYVWGCFSDLGDLPGDPYFSAVLAIFPPALAQIGSPDFPLCLLPTPIDNTSCGFEIAGVAFRGDQWLLDTAGTLWP